MRWRDSAEQRRAIALIKSLEKQHEMEAQETGAIIQGNNFFTSNLMVLGAFFMRKRKRKDFKSCATFKRNQAWHCWTNSPALVGWGSPHRPHFWYLQGLPCLSQVDSFSRRVVRLWHSCPEQWWSRIPGGI